MKERVLVIDQVPGDEPGLAELGRAVASLPPELATFVFSHGESRTEDVNEYVWFGDRQHEQISVIDDFEVDVRYMTFNASSQERANELRAAVAERTRVLGIDELRHAQRTKTRRYGLVALALALDVPDQDFMSAIEQGLSNADPIVRRDALLAASLSRASELRTAITEFIDRTSDDSEKRLARAALAAVR